MGLAVSPSGAQAVLRKEVARRMLLPGQHRVLQSPLSAARLRERLEQAAPRPALRAGSCYRLRSPAALGLWPLQRLEVAVQEGAAGTRVHVCLRLTAVARALVLLVGVVLGVLGLALVLEVGRRGAGTLGPALLLLGALLGPPLALLGACLVRGGRALVRRLEGLLEAGG